MHISQHQGCWPGEREYSLLLWLDEGLVGGGRGGRLDEGLVGGGEEVLTLPKPFTIPISVISISVVISVIISTSPISVIGVIGVILACHHVTVCLTVIMPSPALSLTPAAAFCLCPWPVPPPAARACYSWKDEQKAEVAAAAQTPGGVGAGPEASGGGPQASSSSGGATHSGSQAAPGPAEPLPPGWFEAVDSTYLHTYYFNPSTGERLWERPVPKPALPPGWLEARDPGTGVPYYCNASTGE